MPGGTSTLPQQYVISVLCTKLICIKLVRNKVTFTKKKLRWGRDFAHASGNTQRPTQLPVKWVAGLLPGGKVTGAWR